MSDELGDEQYEKVETRYNATDAVLPEGSFVVPTGADNVALADASGAGGNLLGVVRDDIDPGEEGAVAFGGMIPVRVESSVGANDELSVPDSGATSGAQTPGVAGSGGSSGLHALEPAYGVDGSDYRALIKLD